MNTEISVNIAAHHKGIQIKDTTDYGSLPPNHMVPASPILKNTFLTNSLDSSLLSRTLPEIFQTVSHQYYLNDDPQSSIGRLSDWEQDIFKHIIHNHLFRTVNRTELTRAVKDVIDHYMEQDDRKKNSLSGVPKKVCVESNLFLAH